LFSRLSGPAGPTFGAPNTPIGGGIAPTITTTSLNAATAGTAYSQTLTATGTAPITWSIVSGNISPLTLNSSTGAITGTAPGSATTLNATFRATNAYGTNDKALSISVIAVGSLAIVTSSIPDLTAYKQARSFPIEAAGLLPIDFSIVGGVAPNRSLKQTTWTGGGLPAGLTLDKFTGQLAGSTTVVTGASFTIRVTNSTGSVDKAFSLNVLDIGSGAPVFVTPSLPRGRVYANYGDPGYGDSLDQRNIYVTGKTPITYSVVSGSLPPGITLSAGGVFGGRPNTAGNYTFTVRATNSVSSTDQVFTIEIVARASTLPVITTSKVPDIAVGGQVGWHNTMRVASGAATPITWSAVANANPLRAIPAGISINSASGLISGTATGPAGEYRFLIQASNSAGTDQAEIAMTVNNVPSGAPVNLFKPTISNWYELST
jgi:hypothetical protein